MTYWAVVKYNGSKCDGDYLSSTGGYVQCCRLRRGKPEGLDYQAVLKQKAILQVT